MEVDLEEQVAQDEAVLGIRRPAPGCLGPGIDALLIYERGKSVAPAHVVAVSKLDDLRRHRLVELLPHDGSADADQHCHERRDDEEPSEGFLLFGHSRSLVWVECPVNYLQLYHKKYHFVKAYFSGML